MERFWNGSAAAAALAVLLGGAASAQEFRHRGWAGDRLPGDKDQGCVMAMEVRGGVGGGFVLYGNAKREFRVGFGGRDLGLEPEPGKETYGAIVFDDGPPIALKGEVRSKTLVLFEPLDFPVEGGLAGLVESARSVRLTYGKRYLRARLSGSSRAIEMLARCASAPAEEAPPQASVGRGAGAEPDGGVQSAEFGFLRQGAEASEAHEKLLGAGWQVEEPASAPAAAPDERLTAFRARGLPARACDAASGACTIDYADAYGNELRVTATSEEAPKLRSWRLNPPDAPAQKPAGEGGDE